MSSVVAVTAFGLMALPCEADGLLYHTLSPCRLADTRGPNGQSGGPALQTGLVRAFPVQGLPPCGVPVGAKAVSVNVTAVTPNGQGHLILFPNGIAQPVVSTVNFPAGVPALGNGALVPLGDAGAYLNMDLNVYAFVNVTGGTVHMVLDVTGYFQ